MRDALEVVAARDEDVRDAECRVERERWGVPSAAHVFRPDPSWNVEHHAAAVALAVDVPGAVENLLERREGVLDHLVVGLAVLADRRIERARVAVLDGLRPLQRAVRASRRIALRALGAGCRSLR